MLFTGLKSFHILYKRTKEFTHFKCEIITHCKHAFLWAVSREKKTGILLSQNVISQLLSIQTALFSCATSDLASLHSSKSCANPYFIEKWRCLSSVSLFFCRKALGLLTSSPLPSFLLSEGTHLKNENKVIVPVLFLKSLQMLSVDGRLIVSRVGVRAGGRERRYRYNSSSCSRTSATASQKNTLCYTQLVSSTRRLRYCLTQTHTYMALTGIWGGALALMHYWNAWCGKV